MQTRLNSQISRLVQAATGLSLTAAALVMTGCGAGMGGSLTVPTASVAFQGHVLGGQQPVSGATIQLYAANQTGYGVASTPLISASVLTDGNGNFSITGDYTCPYSSSQVYLTATGGNSGSGTNANLVLMTPLGSCGNLTSSTFISVNELTTVAGAYALSGFMSSPTQLSTSPVNVSGLANAFATVNKLVNPATGSMPGSTLPAGATEPSAELNTLADILASCVNSNGVGGSSTNCSTLFTNATPSGGSAPADTLTAALNIAKNPGLNTPQLFALAASSPPFLPTLTSAPTAYTVALRYAPAGKFSTPSASAVDAAGNVWVTNSGNNTITVLDATLGTPTVYGAGGLNAPSALAFDASGNAWVANKGNSTLSVFTPAGSGATVLTSNLSTPTSVAIDGQGLVWLTNSGNSSVTSVSASGTTVTGSTQYGSGGTSPVAVAINPH